MITNNRGVGVFSFALCLLFVACQTPTTSSSEGYQPREPRRITFTNATFAYMGDDVGEEISDGWLIKFYTDMEIDDYGNPIGPGTVTQLLLNASYNPNQDANVEFLEGIFQAQASTGDISAGTFVSGYMNYIDLPDGRVYIADASFYADIAEGETEMDVDLLNEGVVVVTPNYDGTHTIETILVGGKCQKRYLSWRGKIEPTSYVVPSVPNSTLAEDKQVTSLEKMQLQDKGDIYFLQDSSYRCFVMMLVSEGIGFEWGKPMGTGEVLRLDVLVPWDSDITNGIPEGSYNFVTRNENSSIAREDIIPYSAIPGLPDYFSMPHWSGSWYVEYNEGVWSDTYARIDGGTIEVERGEDGSHHIVCRLSDCSNPARSVTADVTITPDKVIIY